MRLPIFNRSRTVAASAKALRIRAMAGKGAFAPPEIEPTAARSRV